MRARTPLLLIVGLVVLGGVGWWLSRTPPTPPEPVSRAPPRPISAPAAVPQPAVLHTPEAAVATALPAEPESAPEARPSSPTRVSPASAMTPEQQTDSSRGSRAAPTSASAGAVPTEGPKMDKEDIRSAIAEVKPGLRRCYEALAKRDPSPHRVVVRFTVVGQATGGFFKDADIVESTLNDPLFLSCFLQELSQARFRAPRGTGEEVITYPFTFAGVPDAGR